MNTLSTEALQNYKFKFEILYNKNTTRLKCKNNEIANNLVTNMCIIYWAWTSQSLKSKIQNF